MVCATVAIFGRSLALRRHSRAATRMNKVVVQDRSPGLGLAIVRSVLNLYGKE